MATRPRLGRTTLVAALAVALIGCGGAGDGASPGAGSPGGSPGGNGEGTIVNVTLQEWAIGTDTATAPSGETTFAVTNEGPEDPHELVIIRTDLSLIELPTDENGVVQEDGEGIEVIDEVEDLEVGDSEDLTVTLDPGAYVLICNIYDEEEDEAHYAEGMRTSFTVSD
jgi:uncharacterized cupredoxin-like copper-binding protein